MRFGLIVGSLALLSSPLSAQAGPAAAVENYLNAFDRAGQLSGTVLVARGDEILFEKAYGQSTTKPKRGNSTATLFPVASLTKPLTGIVTRTLFQRGVLSADDPISNWLPDFPMGKEITVGHLL